MVNYEKETLPTVEVGSFLEALDIPKSAIINFREYLTSNTQIKSDEIDSLVRDLGEYVVAMPTLRIMEQGEAQDPDKKYIKADTAHIRVEEKKRLGIALGERPVFEIELENPRFFVPFNALNQDIEFFYLSNTPTTKSGGYGVGFIGFDAHLGTKAFIKMLNPNFLSASNTETRGQVNSDIAREARLLGNFQGLQETKAYIPAVYDMGSIPLKESPESLYYAAMEYVDGDIIENLTELSQEEIIDIGRTVAYVLDNMQKKYGIIGHLDIKPSNIMRAKDGRIVLIDWGITEGTYKTDEERELDNHSNISKGAAKKKFIIGTPKYTAPERYMYTSDIRSDQHSLATAMFRMLYGETPEWISAKRQNTEEIESHRLREQKMSRPRGMPINVYDVLEKATEYNPENRYNSCTEFIEALQKALTS